MRPLEQLKLAAISDDKISDSDFEKLLDGFEIAQEEYPERDRIIQKYRPQVARKRDNKSFEGGTAQALSQLRAHLVGKTIKDVRRVETGYGIELVLENTDVITLRVEGGKDSVEPQGFLHWFVARVNFKEWFRT